MIRKYKFYLLAALAVILFIAANSVYIVSQPEQAIVLQFGEPICLVKEPGLKFKVPFIQNVVVYDTRLLNLDPPAQEVVLNDKNASMLTVLPGIKLLTRCVFTKQSVQKKWLAANWLKLSIPLCVKSLDALPCRNYCRNSVPKSCLTSVKPLKPMPRKSVSALPMSASAVLTCRSEVLQAINARMKTERERDAKEFRAQDSKQAQQIRAKAEKERTIIIAKHPKTGANHPRPR